MMKLKHYKIKLRKNEYEKILKSHRNDDDYYNEKYKEIK